MTVKLLTTQCLEFLILKGGCTGSFESTLVKMPHCWKSRATAHICIVSHLSFNKLLEAIIFNLNIDGLYKLIV